jgi:hypothetical protein
MRIKGKQASQEFDGRKGLFDADGQCFMVELGRWISPFLLALEQGIYGKNPRWYSFMEQRNTPAYFKTQRNEKDTEKKIRIKEKFSRVPERRYFFYGLVLSMASFSQC